jgi:RNA polymerase-binding transcription factor DksA
MNEKNAAQFKKLLLARRAELARGLGQPRAAKPIPADSFPADDFPPSENPLVANEPKADESLLAPAAPAPAEIPANAPARALLHAFDAALARIEAGTYGACTACGAEIGTRRLVAFPWATLCLPCQARQEKRRKVS